MVGYLKLREVHIHVLNETEGYEVSRSLWQQVRIRAGTTDEDHALVYLRVLFVPATGEEVRWARRIGGIGRLGVVL